MPDDADQPTVHRRFGVRWQFIDPDAYHPQARTCSDCGRRFVATQHKLRDGRPHCPDCEPVTSIRYSLAETLARTEAVPREVDVSDMLLRGDAR